MTLRNAVQPHEALLGLYMHLCRLMSQSTGVCTASIGAAGVGRLAAAGLLLGCWTWLK